MDRLDNTIDSTSHESVKNWKFPKKTFSDYSKGYIDISVEQENPRDIRVTYFTYQGSSEGGIYSNLKWSFEKPDNTPICFLLGNSAGSPSINVCYLRTEDIHVDTRSKFTTHEWNTDFVGWFSNIDETRSYYSAYTNGVVDNFMTSVTYMRTVAGLQYELVTTFLWYIRNGIAYTRDSKIIPKFDSNVPIFILAEDSDWTAVEKYFLTGDCSTALNYKNTDPSQYREFDFYYRSRYGAEFPWTEAPIVPTDTEITQLESHANSPNNPSKNIGSGISTVYGSVSFINLGTGFNYKVAVLAHDRISGDLVGDGGAVTFTASATTMTVDVGLPIDAKDRDGHKLVLYAYLWVVGEDIPVCEHVEELDEHAFIYIGSSADDEEPEEQEPDYSGMAVDENFNNLGPIENYNSLIWTDRYSKCGDFEIYTPVDMNLFNTLGVDSYLMIPESDRYMIVEKVEIISNATDGNKMCISGRSLESILDRRIIWHKTIIDEDLEGGNTVQNAIKKLITDNIISPPNLEYRRKIPNFIFRDCATDISDLKLTGEYLGDSLYDVICNVCENNNLGFRITIEPVEGKPSFIFQLYQGKNRSFDSSDNVTRVIFSPDMGNMVDCDYIKTKEDYKNVCLVGGENAKSDDDSQIFSSWGSNEHDGISRRELYLSASDLTKKVEGSDGKTKTLSDDEYKSVLQQRGHEELAEHKSVVSIDGTMCNKMFYYGENKDYYLGDIIECEDLYGNHAKSRITEVIISKNTSSYTIYPTFEAVTSEDLSIKIIYATAETFKDDAPQPLTQNKLNTEYFTYDTETCRYTCVKECNIDIYFSWKCKDVPKTKYKSLMRVKVNSLIDPDGCYHYWEVTQGTSGHKAFDNLHCAVGAQFWFEKEEHGNAYINEFTASIHIDDPT